MGFDRDLIPGLGDKSVRKRLRELDSELISLTVVIGVGFSKIFEGFIEILMNELPVVVFGVDISMSFWWIVYTLAFTAAFLLEADRRAREAVEEGKEKAEEVVEEATDND